MGTSKDLGYYLNLKWSYTIETDKQDGEQFFIIRVNELPGVCTDGKTIKEAVSNIREAIDVAIELYLELGDPIPEIIQKERYKEKNRL